MKSIALAASILSSASALSLFRPVVTRTTSLNAITLDSVTSVSTYNTQSLEHLIEEEMVTDDASASALADSCMAEAERLFYSKADWKKGFKNY